MIITTIEAPYKCPNCNKGYSTKGSMKFHTLFRCLNKLKLRSSYECSNCNKRYTTKAIMKFHMHFRCLNKGQFRCKLCKHACSSKGDLKSHIVHKHKLLISSAEVINYLDESLSSPTFKGKIIT
uniref:Zinc finger protein 425-like n=1 Tax=Diabrotica virgifera virgifera TaxID=50390 RepID=A0A6P7FM78_DIAVI